MSASRALSFAYSRARRATRRDATRLETSGLEARVYTRGVFAYTSANNDFEFFTATKES